ncbi:hypothetical protein P3X46_025541 [Hevea brasiliensis]|uniref:RING-type domain-containing protein n=1 Tax=Hevea brasiliensis TaxID=3981 RepID=A0ABQ9L612_HEVBR|nr:hypothetical protein P3X46_025541 [Hevea brasiliensis]
MPCSSPPSFLFPYFVATVSSLLHSEEPSYAYYTESSMYASEEIIPWWWLPLWILDLVMLALTLHVLFFILQCYFWLWKLGGRVLDIEIETITDEDDHKPQLTAGALEKAFPTLTHGKISDKCAICLEKFKEEDKCRMFLPSCIHIFHKACIDLWLSKDNGCPLCGVDLFSKL